MDEKNFVDLNHNVYQAKHNTDFIYIGHDPANQWSAFLNGKVQDLGFVDTLEQAQEAAHRLYDAGPTCALKLEWKLIPKTEARDLVE
jgi:hypothetical protein